MSLSNIDTLRYTQPINESPLQWITRWNRLINHVKDGGGQINPSNSRGYYSLIANLPVDATNGDIALVGETDTIWRYDGTTWIDTTVPALVPPVRNKMVIPLSPETGSLPVGLVYSFGFDEAVTLTNATLTANVPPEDNFPDTTGIQVSISIAGNVLVSTVDLPAAFWIIGAIPNGPTLNLNNLPVAAGERIDLTIQRVGSSSTGEGLKLILNYETLS